MRSLAKPAVALAFAVAAGATAALAQPPPAATPPGPLNPAAVSPVPAAPPAAIEECAACHAMAKDAPPSIGPNLWGVGGRKAGTAPGYEYSPAMAAHDVAWTPEALQAFIARPAEVVPGTTMAYPGQPDPAAAKAIADYLMTLKE